jgi:DNA modification methylase
VTENITIGWRPTCRCTAEAPIAATVLDPFLGAGTTALVADRLGRDCIGIELSADYAAMAEGRVRGDAPLLVQLAAD